MVSRFLGLLGVLVSEFMINGVVSNGKLAESADFIQN
jgi:hypothetical protein